MGCSSSSAQSYSHLANHEEGAFHREYVLGKKIGQGGFAQVRVARLRSSLPEKPVQRAVKVFDFHRHAAKDNADLAIEMAYGTKHNGTASIARQENVMWHQAGKHPNVVEFHEAFFDDHLCFLVLELCESSMFERMEDFIDEGVGFHFTFREMLLGLAHVHERGIVHRDIKPENYMIGKGDGRGGTQPIKLTDFGLAVAMPKKGMLHDVCGTAPYVSPEMLGGAGYDFKTDVWSLGVVVYILLFGDHPYETSLDESDPDELERLIKHGTIPPIYKPTDKDVPHHGPSAVKYCQDLLKREPSSRVSSAQALALPYVHYAESKEMSRSDYMKHKAHHAKMRPVHKIVKQINEVHNKAHREDPTKANRTDEILEKLQVQYGGSKKHLRRSFTELGPHSKTSSQDTLEHSCSMASSHSKVMASSSADPDSALATVAEGQEELMECVRRSRKTNTHTGITLPNFFASEKQSPGDCGFASEKAAACVGSFDAQAVCPDEYQGDGKNVDVPDACGCAAVECLMSETSTASDGGIASPQYWTPASTMPQSQAPSMDVLPPMPSMSGQGVLDLSRVTPQQFVPQGPPRRPPKVVSESVIAESLSTLASGGRGSSHPLPSVAHNLAPGGARYDFLGAPVVASVGPLPPSRAQACAPSPPATPGRFKKMI